jgi:hypothetical protein
MLPHLQRDWAHSRRTWHIRRTAGAGVGSRPCAARTVPWLYGSAEQNTPAAQRA